MGTCSAIKGAPIKCGGVRGWRERLFLSGESWDASWRKWHLGKL